MQIDLLLKLHDEKMAHPWNLPNYPFISINLIWASQNGFRSAWLKIIVVKL